MRKVEEQHEEGFVGAIGMTLMSAVKGMVGAIRAMKKNTQNENGRKLLLSFHKLFS